MHDLEKLKSLADLMFDHKLAALRGYAAARARSQAALERLSTHESPKPDSLLGASAELSALVYQRWADARRAEINLVLASQTHDWLEAREAARVALAKADVLKALTEKSRGRL